jgi:multidrug efflux pump subunit AcrA (membrane-fusion protein)
MPVEFYDSSTVSVKTIPTIDALSQQSELMQEIVSDRPGFLSRWGNIVFLLLFILIGVACWFIKYPDTVQASGILTSINAPKSVISLMEGKLIKLNITENELVDKGQVLGFIESTANHEDILALRSNLDTIQKLLDLHKVEKIKEHFIDQPDQLGELQISYQVFSQAYLSFNNYLSDGFYLKKRAMLLKDKNNLSRLNQSLHEQRMLQEQDLTLVQKTFDANELLKRNEVISDFDYRLEQSKLINKKLVLPQIKSSIISNESQQIEKEKEIIELENSINQQKLIFQQSLNTFKSQIDEWKRKYILTAPINGKVTFTSFIQENQQLNLNQVVCFINPENSEYFAEVVIPQSNFGKVAIGQKVLLRFQSYPSQEFGLLIGSVKFISTLPSENGYLAKVTFENGLTTTYGKKIQYRNGLLANAEIVTKDMRLLERFYFNIIRQVNN